MNDSGPETTLVLPELLQGQWSSAMILTYGADLGFFEQRLAGQLAQVPLRLVLGDGRQLRKKLDEAARTGQRLKMANRSYLAAPIRHSRAALARPAHFSSAATALGTDSTPCTDFENRA